MGKGGPQGLPFLLPSWPALCRPSDRKSVTTNGRGGPREDRQRGLYPRCKGSRRPDMPEYRPMGNVVQVDLDETDTTAILEHTRELHGLWGARFVRMSHARSGPVRDIAETLRPADLCQVGAPAMGIIAGRNQPQNPSHPDPPAGRAPASRYLNTTRRRERQMQRFNDGAGADLPLRSCLHARPLPSAPTQIGRYSLPHGPVGGLQRLAVADVPPAHSMACAASTCRAATVRAIG